MRRHLCILLLAVGLAAPSLAQEDLPLEVITHAEGVVEELDIFYPAVETDVPDATEDNPMPAGEVLWAQSFLRSGAGSVQLLLEDLGTGGESSGWIELLDRNGEIVERIDAPRLAAERSIWTNLAFGSFIEILVVGDADTALNFRIAAISYEKSGERFESIIGRDGRQHLIDYAGEFSTVLPSVEGAVAKLTFIKPRNGFPARFVCTGFLIADDLLLTNEHCVATQEICNSTKVLFGLSINRFGLAIPKEQRRCVQVEKASFPFDYALLRLDGSPGQRWGRLQLADRPPLAGEKIFIVQHPAGEPKQISDEDCMVAGTPVTGRAQDADLSHSCDTLGGSSGSPVLDASGAVIGLHHLGKQTSGPFAELNRAVLSTQIVRELAR